MVRENIKAIKVIIISLFPCVAVLSSPLLDTDFSKMPDAMANLANAGVKGGVLEIDGTVKPNYAFNRLSLKIVNPAKITFRVRELLPLPVKDIQWGLRIYCADGKTQQRFYTRGESFSNYRTLGKETLIHTKFSTPYSLKKGVDSQWSNIEIIVRNKDFSFSIDGKLLGSDSVALLPARAIDFYALNTKIEIDNLRIEPFEVQTDPALASIDEPVFYAAYDRNVDAVDNNGKIIPAAGADNIKLVKGVSGNAVRISSAGVSGLTTEGKWKLENNKLVARENKAAAKINLDLPNLKNLVVSIKLKRLAVAQKDNHFGFFIDGNNKMAIRLFTRGDAWHILNYEAGKVVNSTMLAAEKLPEPGENSPLIDVKLTLNTDGGMLEVNRKKIAVPVNNIFPLSKISIYSYALDCAIDDISVQGRDNAYAGNFDFSENFTNFTLAKNTPSLCYNLNKTFGDSGAVMFWVSPEWNGESKSKAMPIYPLLTGVNNQNETRLNARMITVLNAGFSRENDTKLVQLGRKVRPIWFKNDWNHVALSYDREGIARLYFNSVPYYPDNCEFPFQEIIQNPDIKSIVRLILGGDTQNRKCAEAAFDELKIYRKPLSDIDVSAEYRRFMPVDLVISRSVLDAGKDDVIAVQVAPAGRFMKPNPGAATAVPAEIELKMDLTDVDGKIIKTRQEKIRVDRVIDFELPVGRLPVGEYRIRCTISSKNGQIQRSFLLTSYKNPAAHPSQNEDLKLGKLLFEYKPADLKAPALLSQGIAVSGKLSGESYIEAGNCKGDRISFEVKFPKVAINGKPVMLEIKWPDNRPRMMGLYMYPESTYANHRERLQGGLQSGNEYPESGKMQTARYLFFPGMENYLFEARTMAKNFPAAIAEIKAYAIEGNLPKLKINYPHKLPHRLFGYSDEDQTFDSNLNRDDEAMVSSVFRTQKVTAILLDYMDYTGQNIFNYPVLRYYYTYSAKEASAGGRMFPYRPGELPFVVKALHGRGKEFIGIIHLHNLPEIFRSPDKLSEYASKGMISYTKDGLIARRRNHVRINFLHPEIEKMLLDHIEAIAAREGKLPGFSGFEYWIKYCGTWGNLNHGYEDYTVNLFSKETGIAVPGGNRQSRFAERYAFLTGLQLQSWLKWRAGKVTQYIRKIRAVLDKHNPDLKLFIGLKSTTGNTATVNMILENDTPSDPIKFYYENNAIDKNAIEKINNVSITPIREYLSYRWNFHWGNPETRQDEKFYDPQRQEMFKLNGVGTMTTSYPCYFETFEKSLKQDKYAAYFQDADPKPHGRYFLKELAFNVAALDTQRALIGAQPLGTWGRDAEAREFAQSFGALPMLPFKTAGGANDPVTVRFLETENGTYIYAVSMIHGESAVALNLHEKLTDLSTQKNVDSENIVLKPYQLRSFLIPNRKLSVSKVNTTLSPEIISFYREKLVEIAKRIRMLDDRGLNMSAEKELYRKAMVKFNTGELVELHRQIFSPTLNQLGAKVANVDLLSLQKKMIANNHFAVNCGSGNFYRTPDGRLFFPDQKFGGANQYGYFGHYCSVARNIDRIRNNTEPGIFETEAYDIDGYRFSLANGTYKVKLYMKIGYRPSAKPNAIRFNVDIQGKRVLDNYDLFVGAKSNAEETVVAEFTDIKVNNGLLEIRYGVNTGIEPDARLTNAIELMKI